MSDQTKCLHPKWEPIDERWWKCRDCGVETADELIVHILAGEAMARLAANEEIERLRRLLRIEHERLETLIVINTNYVHPPIPTRNTDWCAWIDGEEEQLCGYGRTKWEAVANLAELKDGEEE